MISGNSLAVPWLELPAFTAEGAGSIPGRAAAKYKKTKPKKRNT